MSDLNILWLTRKGRNLVGAPNTRHEFEQEVAQITNSVFAGQGWGEHREGESMTDTVKRLMPDADWVMDFDNNLHVRKPRDRNYKVGVFSSDLHGKAYYGITSPTLYADMINTADYDAVFMRYPYIYGTSYDYKSFTNKLTMDKHFLAWSVKTDRFIKHEKKYDVGFIGAVGKPYPLRRQIWEGLYYVGRGYKVYQLKSPPGKTFTRKWSKLEETHLVGDAYSKRLGETGVLIFGCSRYLYPLQKFTQASSAGCLVMCNKPSMASSLGFVNGKTYVEVDLYNWEEVLQYYLGNEQEAQRIATAGMKMTQKYHSHKVRARQFVEMLQ